ncbi:MAG: hypothetical protein GX325_01305 [Peptococcaceae bacterium]|nr:hypothetical protein [Peptococcaceae bacterium]
MKKFTIAAPGCRNQGEANIWKETGFATAAHKPRDKRELGLDVFLCRQPRQGHLPTGTILSLLPKLIVIVNHKDGHISLPPDLLEIYNQQSFSSRDLNFTIGSRLEGQVTVPDWNAAGKGSEITREEQIQAAAGAVYRFLLEDVIRETAEWCGHMSSVVGHL